LQPSTLVDINVAWDDVDGCAADRDTTITVARLVAIKSVINYDDACVAAIGLPLVELQPQI